MSALPHDAKAVAILFLVDHDWLSGHVTNTIRTDNGLGCRVRVCSEGLACSSFNADKQPLTAC